MHHIYSSVDRPMSVAQSTWMDFHMNGKMNFHMDGFPFQLRRKRPLWRGQNPPEVAGETGRGSSAGRPAPGSSSVERGLPRGTAESRALRRGVGGRRCCARRAGSRARGRSCPPGPCAAPPMPGSPRTLGETWCKCFGRVAHHVTTRTRLFSKKLAAI